MVVHNPNNWHWVDKNCIPWSKEYFNSNIVNTSYENDEVMFVLEKVDSISGDCDVTQRKGKVLCIYDMMLSFSVSGKVKSEEETFSFQIKVPEFFHDQEDDEYIFEVSAPKYELEIKKNFLPILKRKLMSFQSDLIKSHEEDVKHSSN